MSFMDFFYNKDFFNNINNIYQGALGLGKGAIRGFFTSIYAMIAVPACYVVWKLYQVLEAKGVISNFENTLSYQLSVVRYIADNCFVLLLDLGEFSKCVLAASPGI
jgi:hypothetical protein